MNIETNNDLSNIEYEVAKLAEKNTQKKEAPVDSSRLLDLFSTQQKIGEHTFHFNTSHKSMNQLVVVDKNGAKFSYYWTKQTPDRVLIGIGNELEANQDNLAASALALELLLDGNNHEPLIISVNVPRDATEWKTLEPDFVRSSLAMLTANNRVGINGDQLSSREEPIEIPSTIQYTLSTQK